MALSPLFSPTHVAYTGEQIEVICESVLMMEGHSLGAAVTFRSPTMGIYTTPRSVFDGVVPDPQDRTRNVRRYAPIVG